MGRVIQSYYDIDRGRWCTSNGSPLLERFYPVLHTNENPVLVINLLDKDGEQVYIPTYTTFTFGIVDDTDTLLAGPISGHVNNAEDYADVDVRFGVMSFRLEMATEEAIEAVENYRSIIVYANLDMENPNTGFNMNMSAPVALARVGTLSGGTPVGINSQYRVNPTDGGTDVWDYGLSKWMRAVLVSGVLSYHEAP